MSIVVHLGINEKLPESIITSIWIVRLGPVAWPSRYPNINSLDFFLCGYFDGKDDSGSQK